MTWKGEQKPIKKRKKEEVNVVDTRKASADAKDHPIRVLDSFEKRLMEWVDVKGDEEKEPYNYYYLEGWNDAINAILKDYQHGCIEKIDLKKHRQKKEAERADAKSRKDDVSGIQGIPAFAF